MGEIGWGLSKWERVQNIGYEQGGKRQERVWKGRENASSVGAG